VKDQVKMIPIHFFQARTARTILLYSEMAFNVASIIRTGRCQGPINRLSEK
jgi:hypothetical protein